MSVLSKIILSISFLIKIMILHQCRVNFQAKRKSSTVQIYRSCLMSSFKDLNRRLPYNYKSQLITTCDSCFPSLNLDQNSELSSIYDEKEKQIEFLCTEFFIFFFFMQFSLYLKIKSTLVYMNLRY